MRQHHVRLILVERVIIMGLYGYIRKNYPATTAEQINELVGYVCTEIVIEDYAFEEVRELDEMLEVLVPNDQIIVYDLRVFAKSIKELTELIQLLDEKEVRLISICDKLDTSIKSNLVEHLTVLVQMDSRHKRVVYQKRQEKTRLDGKQVGRPRVEEEIIKQMRFLFKNQGLTMREVAEECGVSLGTVHKYLQ